MRFISGATQRPARRSSSTSIHLSARVERGGRERAIQPEPPSYRGCAATDLWLTPTAGRQWMPTSRGLSRASSSCAIASRATERCGCTSIIGQCIMQRCCATGCSGEGPSLARSSGHMATGREEHGEDQAQHITRFCSTQQGPSSFGTRAIQVCANRSQRPVWPCTSLTWTALAAAIGTEPWQEKRTDISPRRGAPSAAFGVTVHR